MSIERPQLNSDNEPENGLKVFIRCKKPLPLVVEETEVRP